MISSDTLPPAACRVLLDPPAAGDWNMAVDEALLKSAAEEHHCTLRFYQWSQPTLSLGYFQPAAQRRRHPPSDDCPLVRRATGGGAILHDVELTYSLTISADHAPARSAESLYLAVHRALIDVLADLGVEAHLAGEIAPPPGDEPLLCFERRSPLDVLLGEAKICGSAQRRRRGAVLQHGSILLAASRKAGHLPGIRDLTPAEPRPSTLAANLAGRLADALGCRSFPGNLSAAETTRAQCLRVEKYGHPQWTHRR